MIIGFWELLIFKIQIPAKFYYSPISFAFWQYFSLW
jgi:hypothetical protein